MNRETIEKAARKKLKGIVPCEWNQQPFIDIFVIAANWRINSVWHTDVKAGNTRRAILVRLKNGLFNVFEDICDLKGIEYMVEMFAYLDDLIPDRKEVRP